MYDTLYLNITLEYLVQSKTSHLFSQLTMKKLGKNLRMRDRFHISAAILSRKHQPVASVIALDPLRRSMRLVTYRRTDRASETADKYGTFSSFFFCMRPRSVLGNTARILAR